MWDFAGGLHINLASEEVTKITVGLLGLTTSPSQNDASWGLGQLQAGPSSAVAGAQTAESSRPWGDVREMLWDQGTSAQQM